MPYCLVVEDIKAQLRPVHNYERKYSAIETGLNLMVGKGFYSQFHGISEFQIWTSEIQKINYITAKLWYVMGFEDKLNKQFKKAKDLYISNSSLEYGCYECGIRHAKYQDWQKKLF